MIPTIKEVRRATVEDVPKLVQLWKDENLPWPELEKRFKEFQVAVSDKGDVMGVLGLQIAGLEGRAHSEAFEHEEHADLLREKIWDRLTTVANNHGLVRIWTALAAPFWHTNGLKPPPAELLARLPAAFGNANEPWLMVQLREEPAPNASIDREFALFQQAEKDDMARLQRQAKALKVAAAVVALVVLGFAVVWIFKLVKVKKQLGK